MFISNAFKMDSHHFSCDLGETSVTQHCITALHALWRWSKFTIDTVHHSSIYKSIYTANVGTTKYCSLKSEQMRDTYIM